MHGTHARLPASAHRFQARGLGPIAINSLWYKELQLYCWFRRTAAGARVCQCQGIHSQLAL